MKLSTWPLTNTVLRVAAPVTWIFTLSAGILLIASRRSSIALWSAVVATERPIRSSGFLIGESAREMIAQAPSCTSPKMPLSFMPLATPTDMNM